MSEVRPVDASAMRPVWLPEDDLGCDRLFPCHALEPAAEELEPEQEEALEMAYTAADDWFTMLNISRSKLGTLVQGQENPLTNETGGFVISRRDRHVATSLLEASQVIVYGRMREVAQRTLKHHFTASFQTTDSLPNFIANSDVKTLGQLLKIVMTRGAISLDDVDPNALPAFDSEHGLTKKANLFQSAFAMEYTARVVLAFVIKTHPDMMRRILSPTYLDAAAPSFQMLVAHDIRQGKHSLVLQHCASYSQELDIEAYIERNNVTEAAGIALGAMATGAKMLGAPDCPANRFDLCRQVLGRVTPENIPPAVREDITRKSADYKKGDIKLLQAFANRSDLQISKWWQADYRLEYPSEHEAASGKKKQRSGRAANTNATHQSLVASIDGELPQGESPIIAADAKLLKVHAFWPENNNAQSIQLGDALGRHNLVAAILDSNDFARYLEKFKSEGGALYATLAHAIGVILLSPTYREEQSIKKMRTIRPIVDDAGRQFSIWRLSGNNLQLPPETPATPETRATRIFFGHEGAGTERYVRFLGIHHKSDIVKRVARSQLYFKV